VSERIDCGIVAISDEDLRARDIKRAAVRLLVAIARRLQTLLLK
jgi:hypothetical protein